MVSILVIVDLPFRHICAISFTLLPLVSILVIVDLPFRPWEEPSFCSAIKFQSLLLWICLSDRAAFFIYSSKSMFQSLLLWICLSDAIDYKRIAHGPHVSILVIVDLPFRLFSKAEIKQLVLFQSLLLWICLSDI